MSPAAVSVSAFQAENMGATAEVPPRMSCLPPSIIGYPLLGSVPGAQQAAQHQSSSLQGSHAVSCHVTTSYCTSTAELRLADRVEIHIGLPVRMIVCR